MFNRIFYFIPIILAMVLSFPAFAAESEAVVGLEARADQTLRRMSDYLNTLKQFTVHLENSMETVLSSGMKLQSHRAVRLFVRRPDRLRANMKGDVKDQELYYDGKSLTLLGKKLNYYATMKVPATIEAALDHAITSYGLVAPGADLINENCYGGLIEDVEYGFYVGLSTVNGVKCHHLAFRGEEADWQIWIEDGDTPLPRKFVITSKWITAAPQFTAVMTKWDVTPQLTDDLFKFVPPKGAEKIDFLPTLRDVTLEKKAK